MKIVKVEIENFKPYNNIMLPDDNNQARGLPEGTFLIHGNNSMGKTSFIQGMLWGLLGDDLICAQKRKSMVKAGESSCKVDIIFELGGTQFRVLRKLIIKKNKSKELLSREIDFDEEAVLSKKNHMNDDRFVTIINRSKPVNEEVERMLGVSADIIERTVYIKQKDVDRLALADPTELRKLITTLFGLDEFDILKNDLARIASDLQNSINVLKVEVGSLNTKKQELVKRTEELSRKKQEFKEKESELRARTNELSSLPSVDILINIKTNEASISTKNNELALIKGLIREKTSYMASQTERIASLNSEILRLADQKACAECKLQALPSVENLRSLQGLLSNIRLYKSQIMTLINRSHITLDFDPISYPEQVSKHLNKTLDRVESLIKQKGKVDKAIEHFKEILTSVEVLSDMKKNSIKYVEEHNKCPVCNRYVDNREIMISEINQGLTDMEDDYTNTNLKATDAIAEYAEVDRKIETQNKIKALLESLITLTDELIGHTNKMKDILNRYSARSIEDLAGFYSVEDIISEATRLGLHIEHIENDIQTTQRQICTENDRYKIYDDKVSQLTNQMEGIDSSYQQKLILNDASKNLLPNLLAKDPYQSLN